VQLWPMNNARFAELSYLVVRMHQIELAGTRCRVVFDAFVEAGGVTRRRQVDVVILEAEGSRRELVEVQHRNTKIGQPFVDQVQGKAAHLDAAAVTLVSTAGFTAGALARINASQGKLRAVHLGVPEPARWPIPEEFVFGFEQASGRAITAPVLRAEANSSDGQPSMLVVGALSPEKIFATWLTVARQTGGDFHIRSWNLDATNEIRALPGTFEMVDRENGERTTRAVVTDQLVKVQTGNL